MSEPINLPQSMSHRKKRNPRDKVAQGLTNIFHGKIKIQVKKDRVRTFAGQLLV
jgi:hypothetical protein